MRHQGLRYCTNALIGTAIQSLLTRTELVSLRAEVFRGLSTKEDRHFSLVYSSSLVSPFFSRILTVFYVTFNSN